jgi:hypothetical protein
LFPTRIFSRAACERLPRLVNDPTYQATFPAMRLVRDTDREITTTKRGNSRLSRGVLDDLFDALKG